MPTYVPMHERAGGIFDPEFCGKNIPSNGPIPGWTASSHCSIDSTLYWRIGKVLTCRGSTY